MYVLNGYIRLRFAAANAADSIINDSVRVELSTKHINEPSEYDYMTLGSNLVSSLSALVATRLNTRTQAEKDVISKLVNDFHAAVVKGNRSLTRTYNLSNITFRVSYRVKVSEVSARIAVPELQFNTKS